MILAGILAFMVMLVVAFMVGCGLAELEIWMKERLNMMIDLVMLLFGVFVGYICGMGMHRSDWDSGYDIGYERGKKKGREEHECIGKGHGDA